MGKGVAAFAAIGFLFVAAVIGNPVKETYDQITKDSGQTAPQTPGGSQ